MRIPKSFQMFGQKVEVIYDSGMVCRRGFKGHAIFEENKLILQPDCEGTPTLKSRIEQTFCHDFIHWMFSILSEHELSENEKLVDLMGHVLHQALDSFEYEQEKED